MNFKPILVLLVIVFLILQLRNCKYGPEHQDVDPKYKNAHLTAVSAQNLMKAKNYEEALKYYESAKNELEHPNVGGDKGQDVYINYGFIMNEIGTIHLGWALYGKEMNTQKEGIDPATVDHAELQKARQAFETAADFYHRWYANNTKDYERYSKALSNTLANLGTTYKYSELDNPEKAKETFIEALRLNPENGTAERGLTLLEIDPKPYIDLGKEEIEKHKRFKIF